MSAPAAPEPARLVVGVLTGAPGCLPAVAEALVRHFGPLDLVSRWTPFTWTDYYAAEMGPGLQRRLLVFKEPVDPGRLAAVIEHGRDGLVYDRPQELAGVLETLRDPALRRRLGRAARDAAVAHSWSAAATALERLCHEVASARREIR